MSARLESIVRPFGDPNVFPTPFTKPGGSGGSGVVRLAIGLQGGIKSMGYSFSASASYKMGVTHAAMEAVAKSSKDKMFTLAGIGIAPA